MNLSTVVVCLCCFLVLGGCESPLTEPPPETVEPRLPSEIAGSLLDIVEIPGERFFDPSDEHWREALAGLGVAASDLRLVFALPRDSTVDLQLGAFQVSGWEWATRLQAFAGEMEAGSGGSVAFDRRDVGGKSVLRAVHTDESTLTDAYYYPAGDVLFFLSTADEGMAANVLSVLPSGSGAASASSTATAVRSASAGAFLAQTGHVYFIVEPLPLFPACVGWPVFPRQALNVYSMVLAGHVTGLFPFQLMVSPSMSFGEVLPTFSIGFGHRFLYKSNGFGTGAPHWIELIAEDPGLAAVQRWPLRVEHCLNGSWQDGARTLRIRHISDDVTATIESGTLSCGEGGQAFSGTLVTETGIGILRGNDLKACNPEACVAAGHLEKTELRHYTAMVSDDGNKVDVEWERQLFDSEYDDEGNLTACPRTDVVQQSFSISRVVWGPDRPF